MASVTLKPARVARGIICGRRAPITKQAKSILNDILSKQCSKEPHASAATVHTAQITPIHASSKDHRSKMATSQKTKPDACTGKRSTSPALDGPKGCRGLKVDEPTPARELAESCGISVSEIRRYAAGDAGYLKPHRPQKYQRKVLHYTGVVPISQHWWKARMQTAARECGKDHKTGFSSDKRTFYVLVGSEQREINYTPYLDEMYTDLDLLRSWLMDSRDDNDR